MGFPQPDPNGPYASETEFVSNARRIPQLRSFSLVPDGTKLRGLSLVPKSVADGWANFYSTSWDFTDITTQITWAKSVGVNCIRLIGDVEAVHTGAVSLATYVARYEQVVSYCQSQNLYFFAVGSDFRHYGGASQAEAIATMTAQLTMLKKYPNVIAFDVVNEAIGGGSTNGLNTGAAVVAYATTLYNALKPLTSIPLGWSHPSLLQTLGMFTDALLASFDPISDYFDFHIYYDIAIGDVDGYFSGAYGSKPLVFSEYGSPQSAGGAANTSRYKAIQGVLDRVGMAGGVAWAVKDYDIVGSNEWGIFNNDGTKRTAMTDTFQKTSKLRLAHIIKLNWDADIFLSGATGAWVSRSATPVTIYVPIPVRFNARMSMDANVAVSGTTVTGRITVDGVIPDKAQTANAGGSAVTRSTVFQQWSDVLLPGSHVFDMAAARAVGSDTTSKCFAAHSEGVIELAPL